jgi:LUC7 N_terminus
MACEEARAMLDALMGSDRNAPLPKGAAIPGRKRNHEEYQQMMKRKRSCYDKDIDPIYTAWGVDVYDLFINTKSDIGTNPNVVDKGAHEEYMNLPLPEQEKLGYEYILFHKLLDLVRQGDRMVARNKEKLKQELNRKLSQRNYQDFVQDVDMAAVEQLARDMIILEDMVSDYQAKLQKLYSITDIEMHQKQKLELLLQADQVSAAFTSNGDEARMGENESTDEIAVKEETNASATLEEKLRNIKQEFVDEPATLEVGSTDMQPAHDIQEEDDQIDRDKLQTELGQLTLQKQRLVYEISQLITAIVPQNDTVESQRRHLNYVKSDISTDKTVCEISGNNMSSRDADERIAAHYSGKQYVGWKLVRDKLQAMIKKYGRSGPPPPAQNRNNIENMSRQPPMAQQPSQNSYGGGGGRGPYGGGGGRDYADRGGYRSGGGGGGRDTWVRHGPGGGPRGGGGGFNQDRRNPPPGGDRGGWRR